MMNGRCFCKDQEVYLYMSEHLILYTGWKEGSADVWNIITTSRFYGNDDAWKAEGFMEIFNEDFDDWNKKRIQPQLDMVKIAQK